MGISTAKYCHSRLAALDLSNSPRKRASAARRVSTLSYAARLPYDVMENVTDLILRDQKSVCRVTYDLTPAYKYSGIEWQ